MRVALLLALLILPTASAVAQGAPPLRAPRLERPLLVTVGAAGAGLATALLAAEVAGRETDEAVPVVLAFEAGFALGAGLATPLLADAAGADGSFGGALRGALLGGAAGMATTGGLVLLLQAGKDDRPLGTAIALGSVALVGGALVTAVASTRLAWSGYDVRPAALSDPRGEVAPALSFSLDL